MNADTLCRSARQLVALLDAGLLVVNVTDDMADTGLNAALAVIESFTAAVRGVPTADHSALIDAAPELFSALRAIVLETMDYPPVRPTSADSFLPAPLLEAAQRAIAAAEGHHVAGRVGA